MNERLQELARQAGFFANPDVEKFEKFAELIVRECLSVVEAQKDRLSEDSMDWGEQDFGYSMAVNDSVAMVKQHFGVES